MEMIALGLCLDPALVCECSITKMQSRMSQLLKVGSKCEFLVNRRIVLHCKSEEGKVSM